jgi:hypothetical protein
VASPVVETDASGRPPGRRRRPEAERMRGLISKFMALPIPGKAMIGMVLSGGVFGVLCTLLGDAASSRYVGVAMAVVTFVLAAFALLMQKRTRRRRGGRGELADSAAATPAGVNKVADRAKLDRSAAGSSRRASDLQGLRQEPLLHAVVRGGGRAGLGQDRGDPAQRHRVPPGAAGPAPGHGRHGEHELVVHRQGGDPRHRRAADVRGRRARARTTSGRSSSSCCAPAGPTARSTGCCWSSRRTR